MKAEEYKRLISESNIFGQAALNETLKEVISRQEFELAKEIKRVLENNRIMKPELHAKPYDNTTDYFKVDLNSDQVEKIIEIFIDLEASSIGENGETTPRAAFYAALVDKWGKLA
jgi:sugar-specific transcriptional regulator TrmB